MAIVHRKRLGKAIAELRQLMNQYKPTGEEPVSFRINDFRPGPGNELKKMLAWFARPSEAVGLAKLCESIMRFPAIDPKVGDGQLTKQLKSWIVGRKTEANRDKTVAGAKYPHLCRFAEHLHAGLGDSLRIIAVDRPIEASIRSLQDRSNKHRGQWFAADDAACERLQRSLLEHRERFIQAHPKVPVLRIDFAELTKDPAAGIARLVEFLGIDPTEEELESAIAHVNPELRKFG